MNFIKQFNRSKKIRAEDASQAKKTAKHVSQTKFSLKLFIRRYLTYIIISLIFISSLILLGPYIFRPWTKYPDELRAEIAWHNFLVSFSGTCRESCLASRQSYASIWRHFYRQHPNLIQEKLELVFSGDNSELQKAMIKIIAADYGANNLPPFFASLLMDESVSAENKRLIVVFFPQAFNDPAWFVQVRGQISDLNLRVEVRAYALSLLASYPTPENISLVKKIILTENEEQILEAAFKVASTWPAASLALKEEELNDLKTKIISTADKRQRWRRLWLLSEHESGESFNRQMRLKDIAETEGLDSISRGLAAEALRLEFALEINTPEPTTSEWQELYDYL